MRARRVEAGLTQAALAMLAGSTQRFISELEAGKSRVSAERLIAVVAALGHEVVLR